MKDLILHFSWDRLLNLPPSDFLAVVVLAALGLTLCAAVFVLVAALLGK